MDVVTLCVAHVLVVSASVCPRFQSKVLVFDVFVYPIHYFVGAFVDILIGIPPLYVGNMKPKNFLSVEKYSIIDWRIPLAYNRIVG